MIKNDLKPLLGDNWKEKFVHRDLWDPEGYGVASFDLGGEREKVLAMNLETEDIMEYFFDDKPDEWINLGRTIRLYMIINNSLLNNNQNIEKFSIKNYIVYNKIRNSYRNLEKLSPNTGHYPTISLEEFGQYTVRISVHKLVALTFVPNPDPSKNPIVNHINRNYLDFKKENLEWCDYKWNSKKENQKEKEFSWVYKRLLDNKVFNSYELKKEYPTCRRVDSSIQRAIRNNKTFHGSYWKVINLSLEDYLSRHPINPDGWYDDNGLHDFGKHKVRANSCGVLEVDGKLRIGHRDEATNYYSIIINWKRFAVHRLIYEIINKTIIPENLQIDHIIPVNRKDSNNEIKNLRMVTQRENLNNERTRENLKSKRIIYKYDYLGNLISSGTIHDHKINSTQSILSSVRGDSFSSEGFIWVKDKKDIENRIKYIYYRIKESNGNLVIDAAHKNFKEISSISFARKVKYLNTGMPAPDGYYYQQGEPWNILYDPDNKDLIKKRPEIHYRDTKRKED